MRAEQRKTILRLLIGASVFIAAVTAKELLIDGNDENTKIALDCPRALEEFHEFTEKSVGEDFDVNHPGVNPTDAMRWAVCHCYSALIHTLNTATLPLSMEEQLKVIANCFIEQTPFVGTKDDAIDVAKKIFFPRLTLHPNAF